MSARLYDYIITVDDATPFKNGNNLIGLTSGSYGFIANVDLSTNNLKVKISNAFQEYSVGESVVSNHYLISNVASFQTFSSTAGQAYFTLTGDTIPAYENELTVYVSDQYRHPTDWRYHSGNNQIQFYDVALPGANTVTVRRDTGNVESLSFMSSNLSLGNVQSSTSATITAITNSPFIASTNSFTQNPLVRLITVYYPGEWYPPRESGNPGQLGEGYVWPLDMPWRVAEVIGDIFSDLQYNVTFAGESYIPYPMDVDGISTSSDGTIDRVNLKVSNYDSVITTFIENPYLVGNVTSNSAQGYVNGELVYGLDPRTVTGNVHYDQDVVDSIYGKANAPWLYTQAIERGETWKNLKADSRDLLGAVVEIKTTFANHLQYWPEHSSLDFYNKSNVVSVRNSGPYRVGDTVTTPYSINSPQIQAIEEDRLLFLSAPLANASLNENLYIVNDDYDEEAYVKDVFKLTQLTVLNETFAEFELTSWLQYFKLQLPKRKFYKNTCQWQYKGSECQYPGPGELPIPGTFPQLVSNADPIRSNNTIGVSADEDECAKSYEACRVRNNTIHFGGFPGTGRQIPRQ